MKTRILKIVIIIFIAIIGSLIVQEIDFSKLIKSYNTAIYYIDVPADLDEKGFQSTITLDTSKQFHYLEFPTGGTSTSITINDSTYLSETPNAVEKNPLAYGQWDNGEEALIDISKVKPGKYYVHYVSCNVGGIFILTIK
jgi:hypothetical protein